MELITQILAICGAISVIGGAVAVLSGWYKSWKAPKQKQDNRMQKVNILGTEYEIIREAFEEETIDGFCDYTAHVIKIRNNNVRDKLKGYADQTGYCNH